MKSLFISKWLTEWYSWVIGLNWSNDSLTHWIATELNRPRVVLLMKNVKNQKWIYEKSFTNYYFSYIAVIFGQNNSQIILKWRVNALTLVYCQWSIDSLTESVKAVLNVLTESQVNQSCLKKYQKNHKATYSKLLWICNSFCSSIWSKILTNQSVMMSHWFELV